MDQIAALATMAKMGSNFYEEIDEYDEESEVPDIQHVTKKNNILPLWGNQSTMNLNALVLENVRESYYYKNHLIEIEEFQPLLDEIFYKVKHLEPWEKGTRKIQGMTGMCGGVRGVGAGGVVSSAFCLLYRLFNIKLTRKQLVNMINSRVSSYIRGIGFMYIRFTQPPADLWYWFEPYLDDDDEVDPRSGGGDTITFGGMVRLMLTKLDWYGTLFPRIPVPIQKDIDEKFAERKREILAQQDEVRHPTNHRDRANRQISNLMEREDRKRERAAERDRDDKDKPAEKRPKTRCAHHLRHHHCRKHRKQCPHKAKDARKAKESDESKRNRDDDVGGAASEDRSKASSSASSSAD